jgi:biopolymer transport protein ExbD
MSSPRAFALPRSEINVTPLVDVVLVLLIIFMIITPLMDDRFHVSIPRTAAPDAVVPARHLVTVELDGNGALMLNGAPVLRPDLERKLQELFAMGTDRQVFFEGSSGVTYEEAAGVMDSIRNVRGNVSIAFEEPGKVGETARR